MLQKKAVVKKLEEKANDIDTLFKSQELQKLIEKERALMPELPAKAAGKTS
jgi:hypothetical protein